MKFFWLFLFFAFQATAAPKEGAWIQYKELGEELLRAGEMSAEVSAKEKKFSQLSSKISEANETEADKLETKVEKHLKALLEAEYHQSSGAILEYMSFQQEGSFKTPTVAEKLILTSNVLCLGGSVGKRNISFHFFASGCAFYGKANAGLEGRGAVFKQDNIDVYGLKISPGAGMIVSSSGAELGLKLPIIYSSLHPSQPAGTSLHVGSSIQPAASFYMSFKSDDWHFGLEFGKFIAKDLSVWGIQLTKDFY